MAEESAGTSDTGLDSKKLEILKLELEIKKLDLQDRKTPTSKSWWAVAIEFLGLPTAVIAIVIQLTTASSVVGVNEKTKAETENQIAQREKTVIEIQQLISKLPDATTTDPATYKEKVQQNIPQLRSAVDRLSGVESGNTISLMQRSFAKYILLWVLF